MSKLLAVLSVFLLFGSAFAETVEYKDSNVTIQLYDTPCISEKMTSLAKTQEDKETIKLYNAGKVSFKGKVLEACWVLDGDHIDIVDEEGQTAENVSPSIFQVVKEI